jgi:hypothetical protein
MSTVTRRGAAKAAIVVFGWPERMLDPGLANLLKAIVVVRSTAHSIEILRYDRMVCIRQPKVIHWHVSGIANGRAHAKANLAPGTSKLSQASPE